MSTHGQSVGRIMRGMWVFGLHPFFQTAYGLSIYILKGIITQYD